MMSWVLPGLAVIVLVSGVILANRKLGTVRKDGRPHQLPWGIIMVACVLGLFVSFVHMINLAGFETGPEHGLLGRFR